MKLSLVIWYLIDHQATKLTKELIGMPYSGKGFLVIIFKLYYAFVWALVH